MFFLFNIDFLHANRLNNYNTSIELSVNKELFYLLEPVWVKCILVNSDENGPKIEVPDLYEGLIVVLNDSIVYQSISSTTFVEKKSLKQGDFIERNIELLSNYGAFDSIQQYSGLCPGNYTVQFIWEENGYEPIVSNKIAFEIIEPSGMEREAFDIYKQARIAYEKNKIEECCNLYENLLDNFSTSIFVLPSLKTLSIIYYNRFQQTEKHKKAVKYSKKILENYGDSSEIGYANYIVRKYYRKNNDKDGIRMYYKKLKYESKSRKMKGVAGEILKKIEKEIY